MATTPLYPSTNLFPGSFPSVSVLYPGPTTFPGPRVFSGDLSGLTSGMTPYDRPVATMTGGQP